MNIRWIAPRIVLLIVFGMVALTTGQVQGQEEGDSPLSPVANAGSEITYQGTLQADGAAAQGRHDFVFRLWDAPTRGSLVGQAVAVNDVNVVDGQFTALVDFGARVFNGQGLYLEIDVKPSSERTFETLAPRQLLTGAPMAHSVRPGMTVVNSDGDTSAVLAGGTAGVRGTGGTYGGSFSGDSGILAEGVIDDLVLSGAGLFPGTGSIRSDPGLDNSRLVFTSNEGIVLALNGSNDRGSGELTVLDGGDTMLAVGGSELRVLDGGVARATLTASNQRGGLFLRMPNNFIGVAAQGYDTSGGGGLLRLFNGGGVPTVIVDGHQTNGSGGAVVVQDGEAVVAGRLYSDPFEGGGQIELADGEGDVRLVLEGTETGSDGATVIMRAATDNNTIVLDADGAGSSGPRLQMNDIGGSPGVVLQVDELGYDGGQVQLYDRNGSNTITLDADYLGSGTGRITTPVLEITGGADLSEQFDVSEAVGEANVEPEAGMVVCIDAQEPGRLVVCSRPYDATVAGIISGAGDVGVGVLMGQSSSVADGAYPVALTGRVYVWAEAGDRAILPGDLLTTSERAGYAMRASDAAKAYGAIVGKAMTELEAGTSGLVLVLVSLQ